MRLSLISKPVAIVAAMVTKANPVMCTSLGEASTLFSPAAGMSLNSFFLTLFSAKATLLPL
ncbi:MAG: hypothetical protein Q7J20_09640 [Candidatus Nitrotoga sp.]|nr:hypothetical protein [Candidatus Nitrotoga sp.]MDO9448135.1 hypothetical protein [Candidatus Nitrotoga sp.]